MPESDKALLQEIERHLEDLREAWERGALRSFDVDKDGHGKNGLRSNINYDLLMKVRKALQRKAQEFPDSLGSDLGKFMKALSVKKTT